MARRKHEEHEEHMDETWLIPYADLLTLLLALFIVLFASSSVDTAKLTAMANYFGIIYTTDGGGGGTGIVDFTGVQPSRSGEGGSGPESGSGVASAPSMIISLPSQASLPSTVPISMPSMSIETEDKKEYDQMLDMKERLDQLLQEQGTSSGASTLIDSRGLVIRLNNTILFDSGSADLSSASIASLISIGRMIGTLDNYIRIEGHTDSIPINTVQFASNWELSAARATRVLRLLIDQAGVQPEKLSAVSCGQYKPVASNDTEAGQALNRRVEIIILDTKFNSLEEQASANVPY